MATVINNPPSNAVNTGDNSGVGLVIGVVLAIMVVFALIAYALPALRNTGTSGSAPSTQINLSPGNSGSGSGSSGHTGGAGNSSSY